MARRAWFSHPALVGFAVVLLLAGRWIWVAGLGDYAWDWEVAARIVRGEIFYRDFLLLRGPLGFYTLVAMIRWLGRHLFVFHLHLWVSYVLCLGAGLLVARELGAPRSAQITGISLAAVIACPVFTWEHAPNYLAPFLAGIAIVFTLRAQRDGGLWALGAGVATALAVFTKQDVGIAVGISIPLFLRKKSLGVYLAAFVAVFLALLAYFSQRAGVGEVWRQLFVDAPDTKGGFLYLIARATPRLVFRPDLPLRRWWEAAATCAVYAVMLNLISRAWGREPAGNNEQGASGVGAACLAGAAVAIALSFLRLDASISPRLLIQPWPLLVQLIYILFALLAAACFLASPDRGWRAALSLVMAAAAAQQASNPNFEYSAPLVIPVLFATLARMGLVLRAKTAAATVAAVYLAGTTIVAPVSFIGLYAYQPTYALPADSPFRGLRAPQIYAGLATELWQQARPLLRNRRTLWLLGGGGPYLAYGGLPAFSAPYYMFDSFPVRLERRMIESWQTDPPEVVLLSDDFYPSRRSQLLTGPYVKEHVLSQYVEVWRSRFNPRIRLWMHPQAWRSVAGK